MFMDALSATVGKKDTAKKRKRRLSSSKENAPDANEPGSPTTPVTSSPTKVAAAPLKFYQDTLEEDEGKNKTSPAHDGEPSDSAEKKDEESGVVLDDNDEEDDIPLKKLKENEKEKTTGDIDIDITSIIEKNKELVQENNDETPPVKQPGIGCGPNGPPGVLVIHRRPGPKKQLKWKPQECLEEVRFFELDENERVNVTRTFLDAKAMERIQEREFATTAARNKYSDIDKMVEETMWMPLLEVDGVPPHPDGAQSNEKKIQGDREQTVLQAIYFSRNAIPDSSAEPDMEYYKISDPTIIPLDDVTGNPDAINDLTSMAWPEGKGLQPNMPSGFIPPFMNTPFGMPNQWSIANNQAPDLLPMQLNNMPFGGPNQIPNNFNGSMGMGGGHNPGMGAMNGPGQNMNGPIPNMNGPMQNMGGPGMGGLGPRGPGNYPLNMINMNGPPNLMNMNGPPMNMKDRGPTSGNWFRPGGPSPNWMNNNGRPDPGINRNNRGNYNNGPRNWNHRNNGPHRNNFRKF